MHSTMLFVVYSQPIVNFRAECAVVQLYYAWGGSQALWRPWELETSGKWCSWREKIAITPIWWAKAEPKCKTFAWILLQQKILTANNLAKRGWPHDPVWKLCNSSPETPVHLCKNCKYTSTVWNQLTRWFDLQLLLLNNLRNSICCWWKKTSFQQRKKPFLDGLVLYFWWNIYFGGISRRNAIDKSSNKNPKQL